MKLTIHEALLQQARTALSVSVLGNVTVNLTAPQARALQTHLELLDLWVKEKEEATEIRSQTALRKACGVIDTFIGCFTKAGILPDRAGGVERLVEHFMMEADEAGGDKAGQS